MASKKFCSGMFGVVRGALCALRVTTTLAPTRLSVRARSTGVRSIPELVAAAPTMSVRELREELNQCKADYSDCFDADAMRNRLLTTLLIQAQSEATPLPKIPRVAISLSPAWTGLVKEALLLVPAWDFEMTHRMSKRDGFADSVDLTSVKTTIEEFFARDRRELLQAGEDVANVCQDALIALCCGADGVRLVLPVEYEGNEDQFHVPTLVYESPVPSTWRPDPDQMQKSGASKEEIEEVEAAIAAVRERLGEPVRVGEENEVLEVVTKDDFEVHVIASSKGTPVLLFVRAEGCNGSAALDPMLEDAVRDHPAALRLAKVDSTVLASKIGIPELAARGTPQVLTAHGGKFVTGFQGVPSNEQLRAYLQAAADLNE